MNHTLQVASTALTGNQPAPSPRGGRRYFLGALLVPLLGCSAPTGDMMASSTAALDLRAIDQSCARLTACGTPTLLSLGAGLASRTIGDCRLGLGALLAGPSARWWRTEGAEKYLLRVEGVTDRRLEAQRLMACVAAATTCDAIRACRGIIHCSAGATTHCEGSVLVYCPRENITGRRVDCADQGVPCVSDDSPACGNSDVPGIHGPLRCEGNTLVDPGRWRVDCGMNARCTAMATSTTESTGSCVPEGQLCAIGLDGMRHCDGWRIWPESSSGFIVPTVLLSVDRPTTGRCAADDEQEARDCVDGSHLRYCLGNVERSIACADVGAASCLSTTTPVDPNTRGECR